MQDISLPLWSVQLNIKHSYDFRMCIFYACLAMPLVSCISTQTCRMLSFLWDLWDPYASIKSCAYCFNSSKKLPIIHFFSPTFIVKPRAYHVRHISALMLSPVLWKVGCLVSRTISRWPSSNQGEMDQNIRGWGWIS